MDQLQTPNPFYPGAHRLSVVITDLAESEALIHQMAKDAQAACPGAFAGKIPCIYFKMPYIPPYETFRELRQLILRIREGTGLRAHFRGVVAIEVTEWLGHEKEEYFTVLLKYLYDHRDLWQAAFVLQSGTSAQIQRFLSACAGYITLRFFDAELFSRPDRLWEMICRECRRQGKIMTQDAVEILAEAIADTQFRHARSLTLIERSVEELGDDSCNDEIITGDAVRKYLANPFSMLTMMAGKTLSDERSKANDAESLQLRG